MSDNKNNVLNYVYTMLVAYLELGVLQVDTLNYNNNFDYSRVSPNRVPVLL